MLKLDKVSFFYGKVQVIKDVSLPAEQGITTLLGPNGAGKTTLLKLISGLLRPSAGTIQFDGRDLTGLAPYKIVKLGVVHVPERRRIFPELTVRDNLELGAYARGDRAAIDRDLDFVFKLIPLLDKRQKQHGGTLSGGEQQLLAIARGYMSHAKVMLVDEPTLGLAPKMWDLVTNLLHTLVESGIQILLVEENLDVAIELATTLHLLRGGEIVISGTTEELREEIRKYLAE